MIPPKVKRLLWTNAVGNGTKEEIAAVAIRARKSKHGFQLAG
ncbi:MAG TPA: hypothetical protein VJO16_08065 [Candidatus Acidoferrum sp.]|nr:hypothetical protein [Candidatus Acidoferrum sp.]